MSDHSTGSSGSSTNSWTMLSPEETAPETVGPDDGTSSLSGVPGLPEEGTTGVPGQKVGSKKGPPTEAVLSEEGQQQVCQETAPDACEAAAFIDSAFSGFEEAEVDPEIHAPVIHDTITTSPPDSDLLGSTPFPIASESAMLFSEEPAFIPTSSSDKPDEAASTQEPQTKELLSQESPASEIRKEHSPTPEASPEESYDSSKSVSQESPAPEGPTDASHATEALQVEPNAPTVLVPETVTPELLAPVSSGLDPSTTETSPPEASSDKPPSEPHLDKSPTPEPVATEIAASSTLEAAEPEAEPPPEGGHAPPSPSPTPPVLEPETLTADSVRHEEEEEGMGMGQEEEESLGMEEAPVPERPGEEPVEAEPEVELLPEEEEAEAGGDGLRQRHAPGPAPEPFGRSSEDEEEEGEEFQMAPRRQEEKGGFALNKLIVGALVLLCLGSLFFSDDGFDGSEMTEQELLERLTQENQQIASLEAQLKSQKDALDQALAASAKEAAGNGEILQKENLKLKEEVAAMPGLLQELESLRARVSELSQLTVQESETLPTVPDTASTSDQLETANQIPAGPEGGVKQSAEDDKLKAELARQKSLLEDSRKRLEGMKKSPGGRKKGVREGLVEMQKRLSEQVERLDKRHDWKKQQHQEEQARKHQEKKWAAKKEGGNQWGGKKDKAEKWEDKRKHSSQWESKDQNGGKKEHGNKWEGKKDENREKHHENSGKWKEDKNWKHGKNGKQDKESEHSKQHAWKKYHKDWDGRKQERKVEREKRKSERPWDAKSFKKTSKHDEHHHHHHHSDHHHHEKNGGHKHEPVDFWKHQEQKLQRNPGPAKPCSGTAQCAEAEGLVAVELSEFLALLDGYLSKLPVSSEDDKQKLQKLVSGFFPDSMFDHQRLLFSDFAEDVADILEDLADVLDNESLEDDMEEFEREALWKFAAAA